MKKRSKKVLRIRRNNERKKYYVVKYGGSKVYHNKHNDSSIRENNITNAYLTKPRNELTISGDNNFVNRIDQCFRVHHCILAPPPDVGRSKGVERIGTGIPDVPVEVPMPISSDKKKK